MSALPQGWAEISLDEAGEWRGGGTPSKGNSSYWSNGDIPWVSPKDMKSHVIAGAEDHITLEALTGSATQLIPERSVLLVTRSGILRHTLPVGLTTRQVAINQDLKALTPNGAVDPEFVSHQLRSSGKAILATCAKSGTTVDSIDFERLKATRLPVPPLPEQQRIVAKIDSLTGKSKRARDHLDHIPRLVEKYKQAVLAAAFRGDLTREWRRGNPTAIWTGPELAALKTRREAYLRSRRGSRLHSNGDQYAMPPAVWFAAQLSDVGSLQVGYAFKSGWYASEGIRLLRGANVAPGRVSWEDEVKLPRDLAADYAEYRVDAGNIVIAMDRPIISTGLKVARITPDDAGCLLVQRVARYVPSELVDDDYVWHLINSQHFIEHAVTKATGSDLPHISSNDILTTPLPLPCLAEQKEIARRIGMALSWIDRLASEATSARRLIGLLDQAVLAKAFRGELVPQDPADEPASVLLERIRDNRVSTRQVRRTRTVGLSAENSVRADTVEKVVVAVGMKS